MFHSISERPNTKHKLSFTYNTPITKAWNGKAKNELPETAYLPMALHTWWTPAPRLHCTLPGHGTKLILVNEHYRIHSSGYAGAMNKSQVPMPVDRNHCSRMPDHYIKPRSVVAEVSQEGYGDARSFHLLRHAEAGYEKWKCMHSYQAQYEEIMEQLYYLS